MVESGPRRTTVDQRIVSLLRVVTVIVAVAAFLTIAYLVGWVRPGGAKSLVDLKDYPLGKSTTQYPIYVYDLDSASLEILQDKEVGRFFRVHISPRQRWDGFGITPIPGAGGDDARIILRWRARTQLRTLQVTLREGTDTPTIQYGDTFSASSTLIPPSDWTVTEIPVGDFEVPSNQAPSPLEDGVLEPKNLRSIAFTFAPSTDIEIDVASVSVAWRGYNWLALLLLAFAAGIGTMLFLRPFAGAIPADSGALLSTSAVTRTAFILIAASTLYLVYSSRGWITGGPLLLHLALLGFALADELTGGAWSYHRLMRFRYLAALGAGWLLGAHLPAPAWIILSLCAYLPALQYEDQIMMLAVPLIGLAGYLLGTFPEPSLEKALAVLAGSLLLALLVRELFRQVRTSDRTERRLQQSEANYQAIFHAVSEGMLVVEPVSGLVLEVNEAVSGLLGYPANELKSMRLADIVPELDVRPLASDQESQLPPTRETEIARRNADPFAAEVAVRRVLVGGKPRALVVIRDIDRRKRLEQQLRESQKMEAVGQLAGGVAHDFNNLLTVVNCQAELALERVKPQDPLHQALLEIHTAGIRAADLVSQLLAYSRRQMLQPRSVDLRQILTEMQETLTWMTGGANDLVLECREPVDRVMADRRQIEQVIVNLVENSLDAMAPGGKLTVSVRNRLVSEAEASLIGHLSAGGYVELRVTDTGEGMDRETLSHLFEPFFTTKEMGKGTGLGLSTVYGIVRQHHGGIQVYSTVNHGTTFCVLFPRSLQPDQAPVALPTRLGTDS